MRRARCPKALGIVTCVLVLAACGGGGGLSEDDKQLCRAISPLGHPLPEADIGYAYSVLGPKLTEQCWPGTPLPGK